MTKNLMIQRTTASLYTYRPEERMQKQRMVYISSPAVRIPYTKMAPPVFAPTVLDKTPRERPCPSREARGSEGPKRGRSHKSLEDVRKVATPHELCNYVSYTIIAALFKNIAIITLRSERNPEEEVKVESCKLSATSILAAWPAQCRLLRSNCRTKGRRSFATCISRNLSTLDR